MFRSGADVVFDVFNGIVIVVFVVDFIINLIADSEFLASFYFLTDILSVGLLFMDFSFIRDSIFEDNAHANKLGAYNAFYILEILRIVRII